MKRTKLCNRKLPNYTRGEEVTNMVTHIIGGALAIVVLILCVLRATLQGSIYGTAGSAIYGGSMIVLYAISSVYHGLYPNTGKKVMQVIDHCAIYLLIAGTYTPILLAGFVPVYPLVGWGLLTIQWGLAALAITLTAIDLKKYNVFSMICYIGMGWSIIFFINKTITVMTAQGFYLLLSGGIVYTIGAIAYGIGAKKRWFHGIFHIFVVLGSLLQFLAIYLYLL